MQIKILLFKHPSPLSQSHLQLNELAVAPVGVSAIGRINDERRRDAREPRALSTDLALHPQHAARAGIEEALADRAQLRQLPRKLDIEQPHAVDGAHVLGDGVVARVCHEAGRLQVSARAVVLDQIGGRAADRRVEIEFGHFRWHARVVVLADAGEVRAAVAVVGRGHLHAGHGQRGAGAAAADPPRTGVVAENFLEHHLEWHAGVGVTPEAHVVGAAVGAAVGKGRGVGHEAGGPDVVAAGVKEVLGGEAGVGWWRSGRDGRWWLRR
jgi:hypothetical protein